jgi:hypothetical protein
MQNFCEEYAYKTDNYKAKHENENLNENNYTLQLLTLWQRENYSYVPHNNYHYKFTAFIFYHVNIVSWSHKVENSSAKCDTGISFSAPRGLREFYLCHSLKASHCMTSWQPN